jgi:hypothetical protein
MIDKKKQPKNMEYFNYFCSLPTNASPEITSRIAVARAPFTEETITNSKLELNLRKTLLKCYILSIALYGPETLDISRKRSEILGKFYKRGAEPRS